MTGPSESRVSAFHYVNGVGVELTGDAGFSLVFAEAEHAHAGDEHDGGTGIAQSWGIGLGKGPVIGAIFLAVLGEGNADVVLERVEIFAGCPGNKERANLGSDEVVGATGAEIGEIFCVGRVDELEHVRTIGKARDPAALGADASAQEGRDLDGEVAAIATRRDQLLRQIGWGPWQRRGAE